MLCAIATSLRPVTRADGITTDVAGGPSADQRFPGQVAACRVVGRGSSFAARLAAQVGLRGFYSLWIGAEAAWGWLG